MARGTDARRFEISPATQTSAKVGFERSARSSRLSSLTLSTGTRVRGADRVPHRADCNRALSARDRRGRRRAAGGEAGTTSTSTRHDSRSDCRHCGSVAEARRSSRRSARPIATARPSRARRCRAQLLRLLAERLRSLRVLDRTRSAPAAPPGVLPPRSPTNEQLLLGRTRPAAAIGRGSPAPSPMPRRRRRPAARRRPAPRRAARRGAGSRSAPSLAVGVGSGGFGPSSCTTTSRSNMRPSSATWREKGRNGPHAERRSARRSRRT